MKGYVVQSIGNCKIVEDLPMPRYGDYDALVKVESCGVCNGTDTKIIHGTFKGVTKYPLVLGHEGVARVVEIGSEVRNFKVGDLVLMPYYTDVPEGYDSAWGGYAEYNTITDAWAMEADGLKPDSFAYGQCVIPSDFDPVTASMIITFREVRSTMDTFGFTGNKSLVVLGLGPVGLSFVKFAALTGMGPIIAMDQVDAKLDLAKKMGADHVINTKNTDIVCAVREICPDGVDFALDAVGVPEFINKALCIIKPDAKVCVYGISAQQYAQVDWSSCEYNWTLQFSQFPSKIKEGEAHRQIINWIKEGVLDPKDFVSHVFDFKDIDKAFEKIEKHEPVMKMVIRF